MSVWVKMRKSHSEHFSTAVPQKADVVLNAANGSFVHIVSRNASETQPAKLLVFYVKAKGTPPTVLLGEGER